jgi:hypothetical protein
MGGKNSVNNRCRIAKHFRPNEIEVAPISSALLRIACLVILYKTCSSDVPSEQGQAIKKLLFSDPVGRKLCQAPASVFEKKRLECISKMVDDLFKSIIIDLNHEMDQGALSDYKSDLKSRNSVEKMIAELLRSYEKDKARGKADSVQERLKICGIQ